MSRGTKVVILALTDKGSIALKNQLRQDVDKREEFKRDPSGFTRGERSWFKTVSVADFNNEKPKRWEILGFKRLSMAYKQQMYLIIKKEFLADGCSIEDFEVNFHDE